MSHHHFCDYKGHEWECAGHALRPRAGAMEPSVCICLRHHVRMENGDHSGCPIELLACPEHRDEQLRQMSQVATSDLAPGQGDAESTMYKDNDDKTTIGFCLWCGKNFYSMEEMEAHNANDSAACVVFQELKERY